MAVAVAVLTLCVVGCRTPPERAARARPFARPLRDVTFAANPERLARGRYLAEGVLECFLCHSDRDWLKPGAPPVDGQKGAGHVWQHDGDTWLVAPNLTPDPETGARRWTDDMLARAIREGIGHDGRALHSIMWYDTFKRLSDDDVASVVVYVRSIPAVRNELHATRLSPRERREVDANPDIEPILSPRPAPDLSTAVARGRYLTRIADCGGCHSAYEAPRKPGLYGGGNRIEYGAESAFSSNLTPSASGISYYDDSLFVEVIRTGHVKARALSSVMPWIVFRNMTDDDLRSVFAYLQTLAPVHHNVSNTDPPTACPMCGQRHGLGDTNSPKERWAVTVDPAVYTAYAGTYRFADDTLVTISYDGRRFTMTRPNDKKSRDLFALSPHEFFAVDIMRTFVFEQDASSRTTALILRTAVDNRGVRVK